MSAWPLQGGPARTSHSRRGEPGYRQSRRSRNGPSRKAPRRNAPRRGGPKNVQDRSGGGHTTLPLDTVPHGGVGVQSTCFGCRLLRLQTWTSSPETIAKLWVKRLLGQPAAAGAFSSGTELTDKLGELDSLIAMAKTLGEMTVSASLTTAVGTQHDRLCSPTKLRPRVSSSSLSSFSLSAFLKARWRTQWCSELTLFHTYHA